MNLSRISRMIYSIINNTDTTIGKLFTFTIQGLIILSLITFTLETVPDLSAFQKEILRNIEIITVTIFTIEYLLRIFTAPKRREFIFSLYGIIDLLAILPFYISLGIDLRAIRIIRLFRLIRILKLAKYSEAATQFRDAIKIAKEELILFFITTILLLYFSAVGIYYFENRAQPEAFDSIIHSLWWGVTTLTTVGYGDVFPITLGGRIFTFIILMVGLGVVAVPTGIVASSLSEVLKKKSSRKYYRLSKPKVRPRKRKPIRQKCK